MLREVTRPDKSCVSFQYDTFGRRIEKSVTSIHSKGVSEGRQQKVIRFLWNGNNLFHEWEEKCTVGRRKTENKVDLKADYINFDPAKPDKFKDFKWNLSPFTEIEKPDGN